MSTYDDKLERLRLAHYVLDERGNPKQEPDLMTWARWFEMADRQLGQDRFGDVCVSTVFLGLDHNFDDGGPPVLWETMVFKGRHDGYQERYTSKVAAVEGHWRTAEMVRRSERGLIAFVLRTWRRMHTAIRLRHDHRRLRVRSGDGRR